MRSAAEYRKYAEQCIDMAESARPPTRQTFIDMAEVWLELATAAQLAQGHPPNRNAPSSDKVN